MDWKVIAEILGVIGAIASIVSLLANSVFQNRISPINQFRRVLAFTGFTAAWVVLVWIGGVLLDEWSMFMSDREYRYMLAWMLLMPALVAFFHFVDEMKPGSSNEV